MPLRNSKSQKIVNLIGGIILIAGLFSFAFWFSGPATAEISLASNDFSPAEIKKPADKPETQVDDGEPTQPPADQACRLCHGDSMSVIEFPSGESLPVLVDLEALGGSAHGDHADTALACTNCHAAADYQFPHSPVEAEDLRAFELERSTACERCHLQPHLTSHPGSESEMPVVCTDCHSSHNVLTVEQWQTGEGTSICADCHEEAGVELTDPVQLTQIVRGGMFSDRVNKDYCMACHSQPGLSLTFENGDVLSLTIDGDALHDSVHGVDNSWQALDCIDCHDRYAFPHEGFQATSEREYNLERYTLCARCHETNYDRSVDSVHGAAIDEGNADAAVCTDCHGAHDTPTPDEPRERISHTCEQCHSTIFDTYSESVHGEALLDDSNPDVPTCINCHGVHDIHDPTTSLARLRSPELCAQCHADEQLMAEYDISTDVFNTYVADFHGTTVTLFDPEDPNAETNKAVCYDCHGVHDIRPVDDPEAGIKANLLVRCQQCHPDATENFSDAWTSHYQPSLEHNPLVFLVDQFYAIVIPLTLGFFGFLVVTDIYRKVRKRIKR